MKTKKTKANKGALKRAREEMLTQLYNNKLTVMRSYYEGLFGKVSGNIQSALNKVSSELDLRLDRQVGLAGQIAELQDQRKNVFGITKPGVEEKILELEIERSSLNREVEFFVEINKLLRNCL